MPQLAKLLRITGTQVPPPHPQCPSVAVFLYYKPVLKNTSHRHLLISCTSCGRKSLGCTGQRERESWRHPRGVMFSEGSFEPGLNPLPSPAPLFLEVQLRVTLPLRHWSTSIRPTSKSSEDRVVLFLLPHLSPNSSHLPSPSPSSLFPSQPKNI